MNLRSVGRLPLGLLWIVFLCFCSCYAQVSGSSYLAVGSPSSASNVTVNPAQPERTAIPSLVYTGSYSPDGKYEPASNMTRWYNKEAPRVSNAAARPAEVPPFVDLHPRERTIENLKPPLRAARPAKGKSFWAGVRDDVITFAYGREQLLLGPHHVVVDSTGRVILTDPAAHAIHVLDGENSFRISSGPNRRLFSPAGIALDAEDNIYVADSEQGLIAVFDRNGAFLRYIGKLGKDETLFHYPVGIAIDRGTSRLYVLDSERHLMFILDLQGRELKRVGRYNGNDTVVEFEYPTEIAVGQGELAIMDAAGTHVWITDLDGTPQTNFRFSSPFRRGIVDELGLAIDSDNRVYLSNGLNGHLEVYDSQGRHLETISRTSQASAELQRPAGLWMDAGNRLFVADQGMRRVELFQVRDLNPEGE